MDTLTARPELLKQSNLTKIRKVIKSRHTATRAEIAADTRISFTTIRTLLTQMLADGEIECIGYDESSGGRKARRYRFCPDHYYGAAFCLRDHQVHCLLINVYEEIVETQILDAKNGNYVPVIMGYLDQYIPNKRIKAIGIGVPGVVDGNSYYWKKDLEDAELHKVNIGDMLAEKYGIPVVLENDMNATALGFGRCYMKEFPGETPETTNMAYLHFVEGCVGAGFISEGKIVRGYHNFAGELGLVPMENDRFLDECMSGPMDDPRYIKTIIQVIGWVCGILNPQYVALGGPDLRKDCLGAINDGISALLPSRMAAEILYAPDVWHDYYDGMAGITAAKMFEDVQFIKE